MIALYLLCAVTGVSFMGLSALLGHFGGHGGGHDAGGHGGGHGHVGHGSGHGQGHAQGHGQTEHLALPYFSPTAWAAYITGFGSAGLVLTEGLHLTNPLIHVPVSLAFAGGFGVALLFGMAAIADKAESNALSSLQDVIGTDVEVTIAIPADGTGEVAFVAGGTRQTAMARAEAGQTFAQGSRARVTRSADGALFVTLSTAALSTGTASVGEPVEARPAPRDKVR
ncbi:MAG: hypothetical protein JST54_10510 [Deltaproteobacteria bacterium]|nr:hypothetical protein [Deltaproteobacteria bacterium]